MLCDHGRSLNLRELPFPITGKEHIMEFSGQLIAAVRRRMAVDRDDAVLMTVTLQLPLSLTVLFPFSQQQ